MPSAVKVWRPISARSPDHDVLPELHGAAFAAACSRRPSISEVVKRHHALALGIEQLELEAHEAHVGTALGGAGFKHGRAERKLVVGTDRQKPPHLVDARRAHRARIADEGVDAHPHQDAASVPAGCGEPAQHGRARGLSQMHRLGIEFGRERDHLVARQAARAVLEDAARREIFPSGVETRRLALST